MTFRIGFKTSPQAVDWATLNDTWAAAGQLEVFDAGWLNDHLVDIDPSRGQSSWEAFTLLAALARHVPGKWVGHAVLSNTFRHPAVLAKAATVMDHFTDGRFILGLGAGWLAAEHEPMGISLPPIGERIDRLESAVAVLEALFSSDAAEMPGVTRPDDFYPLAGAVNSPSPLTPGGPPIYLGGQKRRGIALAARSAKGWIMPGDRAGDFGLSRGPTQCDSAGSRERRSGSGRFCVRRPGRVKCECERSTRRAGWSQGNGERRCHRDHRRDCGCGRLKRAGDGCSRDRSSAARRSRPLIRRRMSAPFVGSFLTQFKNDRSSSSIEETPIKIIVRRMSSANQLKTRSTPRSPAAPSP